MPICSWLQWNNEVRPSDILSLLGLAATATLLLITRDSLKTNQRMVTEMENTRTAQDRAMFEATFFQMLELLRDTVSDMSKITNLRLEGREVIFELYRASFREAWLATRRAFTDREERTIVVESYNAFFENNQMHLGHYFHTLYHVINYVDSHAAVDRALYIKIVRAQLSTYELALLSYHSLSGYGRKLLVFVEKYGLLQDLLDDTLLDNSHRALHMDAAYQETPIP